MSNFQISNLLASTPIVEPRTTWRCANLPTTLQVLNSARDNYPHYISNSNIDSLRESLTQTIYVALINASASPSNGIEMPTIASLAPNNTSLHRPMEKELEVTVTPSPDLSRRDSASSPAKSELSINTDISGSDIRSEMGSLSLKSEVSVVIIVLFQNSLYF